MCLESILLQDILPTEVIVVDDDEMQRGFIQELSRRCEKYSVRLLYINKKDIRIERGTSRSRNIGIKKAQNEIVFIFDDDVQLEKSFFSSIMHVWEENSTNNLIGVGGVISNNRKKSFVEVVFNKMFRLTSSNKWDITDVGFQVWDDYITKYENGYYVHGGVCSYKKTIVSRSRGFTQFGIGRAALEDVDFCIRAKNENYIFTITSNAKVKHMHNKNGRDGKFRTGFAEGRNRKIIYNTHCHVGLKSNVYFLWSYLGWMLRQFLARHFYVFLGLFVALLRKT